MSTINSKPYLATTAPKGGEKKQTINSVPYLVELEGGGGGAGFEARIVDELPETGENGVMYLVANGGATGNTYDEFLWIESEEKFEKIGTTEVIPPEVVQETGQSMTAVMSQKAVTDTIFADNDTSKIRIGGATNVTGGTRSTQVGGNGRATGYASTAYGFQAIATSGDGTAIGFEAKATASDASAFGYESSASGIRSVAAGSESTATVQGEFSIGNPTKTNMYNGTGYRLLTNVYDPQNDHDAATKGYVDASAPAEINSTDWSALWQ